MKRILGMPGTSPKPPGIPEVPWARPWDPRGRPWDALARPCDPPGTSLRFLGDAPGTPADLQGPLMDIKKPYISANMHAPEALDCCVRTCPLGQIA